MKKRTYAILAIILAVSFGFFYANAGLVQYIASIPVVASLVGLIVQILRDQASHDRAVWLQESQNGFLMGAMSHMANRAFDKHVEFCEAYLAEAQETIGTLFAEGATPRALEHSYSLYRVQQKYRMWLTPKIEAELEKFERAIRTIGANARLVRESPGEARQADIQEMHKVFAEVMGFKDWRGEQLSRESSQAMLISRLRNILGTEELTEMRMKIAAKARGGVG